TPFAYQSPGHRARVTNRTSQITDALERLADAEVDAPAPLLRLAVHEQIRDRVHLIAEIDTSRADRRQVSKPRTHRHAQIAEIEVPRLRPDVAVVDEADGADPVGDRHAHLARPFEHREAADREAEAAQRAHLVASPAADARGAAEEE